MSRSHEQRRDHVHARMSRAHELRTAERMSNDPDVFYALLLSMLEELEEIKDLLQGGRP